MAAGYSERFGEVKQIAEYRGRPLLLWSCQAAVESAAAQIIVVANSHFPSYGLEMPPNVVVVENLDSKSGMASSIRSGIAAIEPGIEAAVIVLGDQPLVAYSHIDDLVALLLSPDTSIAASRYHDGSTGVPAAFSSCLFDELSLLTGDQGARKLIQSHQTVVKRLDLKNSLDIDVPEDLAHGRDH